MNSDGVLVPKEKKKDLKSKQLNRSENWQFFCCLPSRNTWQCLSMQLLRNTSSTYRYDANITLKKNFSKA